MRSVMIRGKRFRVVDVATWEGAELGYCTNPDLDKEIAIPIDGDTEAELDTIIHELLHACHWDMSEEAVEETATCVARALWRLGWRKD